MLSTTSGEIGVALGINGLFEVDPARHGFKTVLDDDKGANAFCYAPDGFVYGPHGLNGTAVLRIDLHTGEITTIHESKLASSVHQPGWQSDRRHHGGPNRRRQCHTRRVTSLPITLIAQLDVAAASGIVVHEDALYVLADDELELPVYDRAGTRRTTRTLLDGALPEAEAARKAVKPDLEALVLLPGDILLALGSGSTPLRQRAVWLDLRTAAAPPRIIDLGPLYERLRAELPELNIEGAALLGDVLLLGSRGNGPRRDNALIHLDWPSFAHAVQRTGRASAESVRRIDAIQLGELAAQPLGLTDLATAGGRLFFSAAAEASPNTYDDGVCVGSALGILSSTGTVEDCVHVVSPVLKIEGLWATPNGPAYELLLVADPDDRAARAPLLAATYQPPKSLA